MPGARGGPGGHRGGPMRGPGGPMMGGPRGHHRYMPPPHHPHHRHYRRGCLGCLLPVIGGIALFVFVMVMLLSAIF